MALTAMEASVREVEGRAHCVVNPSCTIPKQIHVDYLGYETGE